MYNIQLNNKRNTNSLNYALSFCTINKSLKSNTFISLNSSQSNVHLNKLYKFY